MPLRAFSRNLWAGMCIERSVPRLLSTETRKNWWQAAKAGRQDAYAEIVERHSPVVYNLALRLVKDPNEAEEVLQETFISAFKALPRFEGRSQLGTWLYRIGYNAALMHLRKRRAPTESLDEPVDDRRR